MAEVPTTTRRGFLGAASALAAAAAPATERPNILYIMTDQQHSGMMSCTGNPWVKTPAMDSIVASGTRFELAYSGNPVCVPARTSMMTGRFPSHFGIRSNNVRELPREVLPAALGQTMRAAGYRTAFGGKTHWPKPMTAESIGFEYLTADERDVLAGECATFLKQKHDKPFFLVASFINPHDICYMAIDAFTKGSSLPAMYPKSVVERERVAAATKLFAGLDKCPPLPGNHGATDREPGAFSRLTGFRKYVREKWGAEEWRLHRWVYARLTEEVDAQIGRVLAALRETGLDRNTVIIFSSDHGDMDSAHGFEHKSLPYEESARVPFVISWPGHVPAGRIDRKQLVGSTIDLYPTICDFAGAKAPEGLPGRSLRPIAEKGSAPGWREDIVIECGDSRTLRSARYKYSLWEGPGVTETLFDMTKDAGEMKNLATVPAASNVLAEHRKRLRQHIEARVDEYGRALFAQQS
ncbi:MAG: sulfatase-like hydrolase/transferase [Acidobacteria bacterium]|nr:sulfatase-like hydrolase/transferase [Acidobacteriota bacterium]